MSNYTTISEEKISEKITAFTLLETEKNYISVKMVQATPKAKYSQYKVTAWYRMPSTEKAAEYIQKAKDDLTQRQLDVEQNKIKMGELKKAFVNPYTIGQILHTSWGYDQTNIDYYQVTKVGKMSIGIRPICATCREDGFMTGNCIPIPNKFLGEETTQIIKVNTWDNAKYAHHVSDPSGHGLYCVSEKDIKTGIRSSWYA